MMGLVVDASVAVKWLVAEEGSDAANCLLDGSVLYAPRLMVSEIANTLWRKARQDEIERGRVGELMAAVPRMPILWSADETVGAAAVRIAVALDRPVYDCMYLALAQSIGTRMVTADVRFVNALAMTEHKDAAMTLADLYD